jgi:hypothetical protein
MSFANVGLSGTTFAAAADPAAYTAKTALNSEALLEDVIRKT